MSGPTRVLLVLFGLLTALGVLALFAGARQTDRSFAWTIQPPLAAAFCGAAYAAGLVLVVLTLRADRWLQARWPLATILVFTVLTLIATLRHFARLHFSSPAPLAVAAAWFWLVVYVVVPIGMIAVVLLEEHRFRRAARSVAAAGERGPEPVRLPVLLTAFLLAQGVLLTVAGTALYLDVGGVLGNWPWALTPFVGMVTGAWLVSFGIAAFVAARVDVRTLGPAAAGYTTFGVLQLLAAALHRGDLRPGAVLTAYLVVAAWVGATGAWGWVLVRRSRGR